MSFDEIHSSQIDSSLISNATVSSFPDFQNCTENEHISPTRLSKEDSDPRSLRSLLMNVYIPKKLRGTTQNTKSKYFFALAHFATYLSTLKDRSEGYPRIQDLDDEIVEDFLKWMKEQGLSAYTANSYGSKLVALWAYLSKKNYVEEGPAVKRLPQPKLIPIAWTEAQAQCLFSACWECPGLVGKIPARLWWTSLHCALLDAGERIEAMLLSDRINLDFESGVLYVPADIRKGKTEDKLYQLRPGTVWVIRLMCAHDPSNEKIWPWPMHRSSLWNHLNRILESAGLPTSRKHKFHAMRKTHGSHLKKNGGNPRQSFGHSQDSVTDAYIDPRIVGLEEYPAKLLFEPNLPILRIA